jgi:NAD(P)-dependent dehydrogenase (short-subunit alcohol dehydrogenase family)
MTAPRRVVVTGAGRGIGRWVAKRFGRDGDRVALVGLDGSELAAVASEIDGDTIEIEADLSDPASPDLVMDTVDRRWGGVDVLVNNAARFDHQMPVWEYRLQDWRDIVDVNVTAAFLLSRNAARLMIRDTVPGRIVNVGAIQQWSPLAGWSAYAASKGALASLTRALAVDLAGHGILVNAVAPGGVDVRSDEPGDDPTATLLGRLGHPAEIAEVVAFLASPAASFVVGEVIRCDGGRLLLPRSDPQQRSDPPPPSDPQQHADPQQRADPRQPFDSQQ